MSANERTWIGFLRAINLGARRKFPKSAIIDAVSAAGGSQVETYINTGNVRFDHRLTDRAEMEASLEEAFLADRGFAVPTICLTPAELVVIAADAAAVGAGYEGVHYISLLKTPVTPSGRAALEAKAPGVHIVGRAVHLLVGEAYHTSSLDNALVERHLGVATARNVNVIRTLAERWS